MKKIFSKLIYTILVFSICTLFSNIAFSQEYTRFIQEIDTPTAYTIGRGTYNFSVLNYDEGGVETKAVIGLHDNIFVGVSFDCEHLIGKQTPNANVPGVVAKIKFTDGWEQFPISIAAGYDSFYMGSIGKTHDRLHRQENEFTADEHNRMIYGPFFVITKPIYLFDNEQHFSLGVRVPTQPDYIPEDTSYFVSLDIPMGFFTLKGEIERVYYNFDYKEEWLYNFGFHFSLTRDVGVEFNCFKQENEQIIRTLRIEYSDTF